MQRWSAWLLLLVLFGSFGATVWYVLGARLEAGKGLPGYSVYSEDRDGFAESARLLRKLGWQPVAVTRPIEQTRRRGLLIVAEPAEDALEEPQAKAIIRWVEQGNVLLLLGAHPNAIHRELGVEITGDFAGRSSERPQAAEPGEAGGYTDRIDRLAVEGRRTIETDEGLPLWWLDERPGAVMLRRSAGRVIVVADPSLLTRRGLSRDDNVLFLYNVALLHARAGRIYFDEYHHGLRSGGGFWGYLRYHDQEWLLGVVLLVAAVAGWSLAVRLGPAVGTPRPRRADGVDYATAIARIYRAAGVHQLLARAVSREFLTALCRWLHLPRRTLPAEVLATWKREHPGASSQPLEQLLRGAVELRKGSVPERQLLAWTCAFDRFLREER